MSGTTTLAPPTLEQVERAIDEVVSLLVSYRQEPPLAVQRAVRSREREPIHAMSGAELIGTELSVLRARDAAKAPVEMGLKHSLKKLGQLVYDLGGDEAMIQVAERVCDLDPANWQRRMSPINAAWDSIGAWHA